jgi:hypothetical protein
VLINVKITSVDQVGLLVRLHDRQLRYFMSAGTERVAKIKY